MTAPPDDLVARLDKIHAATPHGEWAWWTSNSWRRLTSDTINYKHEGDVLCPTRARSDGHPDLIVSEATMEWIAESHNAWTTISNRIATLTAENKALRQAVEWYAERAQSLARYAAAKPSQANAMVAVVTELSLDAGMRAANAGCLAAGAANER